MNIILVRHGKAKARIKRQGDPSGSRHHNPILIMAKYMDEITLAERAFVKDQTDIENVHQIRVKLRQIRSLLSFMKPLLNQEEYWKYKAVLQGVSQRFSRLRQLDVLYEGWSEIIENSRGMIDKNSALSTAVSIERKQESLSIKEYISEGLMADELREAFTWIRALTLNMEEYVSFADNRAASWSKKAKKMSGKIDFNSIKELHSLRVRYKKLRYVTDSLKSDKKNKLKKIQDALGSVCDSYLNISLLEEIKEKYQLPGLQYEMGLLTGYQLWEKEKSMKYLKTVL